jgi:hypothetical protein
LLAGIALLPQSPAAARSPRAEPRALAAGSHWRLRTGRGPVHVWKPDGFRRPSAGLVVYVHGHNLQVDQAWDGFRLAEQFRQSRQNALFVVPGAPASGNERVRWPSLRELAREVSRQTGERPPPGHWVAIGHSGGYRTLVGWLEHPRLDHLILLDALYANEPQFESWLTEGPRARRHRLFLVSADTRGRTEAFLRRLPFARRRASIPDNPAALSRRERRARLLCLVSQYDHNQMVRNGKVLPLLLRLTRLEALP